MRTCDATTLTTDTKTVVRCTLPIGHGGNHAVREEEQRLEPEATLPGVMGTPTTVCRTIYYWSQGGQARPHLPRTT